MSMDKAIGNLEQAKRWLEEAIPLAKEGTLHSLLAYYKVGYKSGTWHFPTMVTEYEHGIDLKFAQLINEVIQDTGFYVDEEEASRSSHFTLYFGKDESSESSSIRKKGIYIGEINEHKQIVRCPKDFDDKIGIEENRIEELKVIPLALEKGKKEIIEWLRKNDNLLGLLTKPKQIEKYKMALANSDEAITKKEAKIQEEIKECEETIKGYKDIKSCIPKLVSKLEPYGFVFEGYFNRKKKKISIYRLIDRDEKEKLKGVSTGMTEGVYHFANHFIAFDSERFNQKEISMMRTKLSFRGFEITQDHFIKFLRQAEHFGVEIEGIKFDVFDEGPSESLNVALEESLTSRPRMSSKLVQAAKRYQDEGYDISEISFKIGENSITLSRTGRIGILGDNIVLKDIVHSEVLFYLLNGFQKQTSETV